MPNGKIFCSAVHVVRFYTAMQSIARIGKSLKKTQAPRIYNQHQFAAQTNVYKKFTLELPSVAKKTQPCMHIEYMSVRRPRYFL